MSAAAFEQLKYAEAVVVSKGEECLEGQVLGLRFEGDKLDVGDLQQPGLLLREGVSNIA